MDIVFKIQHNCTHIHINPMLYMDFTIFENNDTFKYTYEITKFVTVLQTTTIPFSYRYIYLCTHRFGLNYLLSIHNDLYNVIHYIDTDVVIPFMSEYLTTNNNCTQFLNDTQLIVCHSTHIPINIVQSLIYM